VADNTIAVRRADATTEGRPLLVSRLVWTAGEYLEPSCMMPITTQASSLMHAKTGAATCASTS
jgi:hypothetical protein